MERVYSARVRLAREPNVLVSSMASDSHTWNLVFLQLLLEELGYRVTNLGACVPDDLLVAESVRHNPDLIVLSSVNGHGFNDGRRVIARLRATRALGHTPIVIGGKLGTTGAESQPSCSAELIARGFDAVFTGEAGVDLFRLFLDSLEESAA
jgi:methylaspartate mutase sigma subunit